LTIQDWAKLYIDGGWGVVPLAPKAKRVTKAGWIGLDFTAEDFRDGDNLGLRSVGGLVFVDLDSPEVVAFGDAFLPATPSIYGRPSKLRSKRIYKSTIPKTIAYKDSDNKKTLIEVRSNHQDMAPPSIHPSGEGLSWESEVGDPAEVDAGILIRCVKLCATAAVIARHFAPPGTRHDWTLALAGTLRRRGVSEDEALLLIRTAAKWSRDEKINDRMREVSSTFAHSDDENEPYTGATKLKELATGGLTETLVKLWGAAPASTNAYILNTRSGLPDARSIANITLALDRLGVALTFDAFARKPFISYHGRGELLEEDNATDLWLDVDQKELFRPTKDLFIDVLKARARQASFHPILDYLASLEWDGTPRLDTWLTSAGSAANTTYTRSVASLVLIAAVRRVRVPGVKFDEMLILESPTQGLLKSTAIRTLCHDPKWYGDDLPLGSDAKSVIERTSGKWLIEASDLSGMRASEHEKLKSMLSRQVDGPVRLAYARLATEVPRQFILIGTTNSSSYLSDTTGNRRFWPVLVKEMDVAWLRANRDQLWAEAAHREHLGEPIRLDTTLWAAASLQQQERVFNHPWLEALNTEYAMAADGARVSPDEIWNFLGVPMDRRTMGGNRTIAASMQTLGFRRITMRVDGKSVSGWGRDT
jgi:hypothetical protein